MKYGGTPFISHICSSYNETYQYLLNLVSLEIERNRIFYVDNDFYENIHLPNYKNCKIFSIREREVEEWKKYLKNDCKNNSNIIYFNDLLDKAKGR